MSAVIGILAAGRSSRMQGRDKLLEDVDGEPLLSRQLRRACSVGPPVLVALPSGDAARRAIVEAEGATVVDVEDPGQGMSRSIAALAHEAEQRRAETLLLHLADMPEIETSDLSELLAEALTHPGSIVRAATKDGRPGHPVAFPARLLADLQRLTGDQGARDLISQEADVNLVRLKDLRASVDLDTPEDWAAWRASRK